jgi:hypothetical protein
MTVRHYAQLLGIVAILAGSSQAGASDDDVPIEPPGEPTSGSTLDQGESASIPVRVILIGDAGDQGELESRIRSWFGAEVPLTVVRQRDLVTEQVLSPEPGRVSVWVTPRSSTQARLYFVVPAGDDSSARYLIRDVPLGEGLDEVGSERIAQVVHSSVSALLVGEVESTRQEVELSLAEVDEAPVRSEPTPTPAVVRKPPAVQARPRKPLPPTPPPDSTDRSPLRLVLAPFYRVAWASAEGTAHGPGWETGVGLLLDGTELGARVRGQLTWPRSRTFDGLEVTLSERILRFSLRADHAVSDAATLNVDAGPGVVWLVYRPTTTNSDVKPTAGGMDARVLVSIGVGAALEVDNVQLGVRAEVDLYPSRSHYDVATPAGTREIARTATAQPALLLEARL